MAGVQLCPCAPALRGTRGGGKTTGVSAPATVAILGPRFTLPESAERRVLDSFLRCRSFGVCVYLVFGVFYPASWLG